MSRRISNSEMETFRDCRRRWYLSYVRRLVPVREKPTGALAIGNRVHTWMEHFYKTDEETAWYIFEQDAIDDLENVDSRWRKEMESDIALCRAMLEGFVEWLEEEGLDADLEIIGVEESEEVAVPGTEFVLLSKRDIVARRRSTGELVILDWKTTGDLSRDELMAGMKTQPKLYMVMDRMLGKENLATALIYTFLRKVKRGARAKPPFYKRVEIYHSDEELRRFYLQMVGQLQEIGRAISRLSEGEDANVVAYPSPTKDCTWKCPFFTICPTMDVNPSGAELVFREAYQEGNPYERYDEGNG